jgi:hypothetical protein
MSEADYEAAVAPFLKKKGVTRCPTVCVVPTQATVAEADRAAYRNRVAAEIAQEVSMFFEDQYGNPGSSQKEPQHHAGGAAAGDVKN